MLRARAEPANGAAIMLERMRCLPRGGHLRMQPREEDRRAPHRRRHVRVSLAASL